MYLLLYIIPILLIIMAQTIVTSAYSKYKYIHSLKGYTGEMVARMLLQKQGLKEIVDVKVSEEGQQLADFYDPRLKSISLSNTVYYGSSVSSIAIAAHEVEHAVQHAEGNSIIYIRNKMLPYIYVISQSGWVILIIGFIGVSTKLIFLALFCLVISTVFQMITLPLELSASKKAFDQLEVNNIIDNDEKKEIINMLNAIAFTYVASLVSGISYFVRLFLLTQKRSKKK